MGPRTRREFGCLAGAALVTALGPRTASGQAKARVVVIGGGIAGTTVAKYLAISAKAIGLTLVEPRRSYTTCFFSNHYLAGLRPLQSLVHGYDVLAGRYEVAVVHEAARSIDAVAKTVVLESGAKLTYDRLVVAPGIAFRHNAIEGYDAAAMEVMPHAWIAGPQSELLRRQLESMEDGGLFVLAVPPDPIRCPPAPYERASLIAAYFQRSKPKSKILILDAKDGFNGQELFEEGWNNHYPGIIEWLPAQFAGGAKAVDVATRTVIAEGEKFKASVANVIPAQMAGDLAQEAGLTDQSGWCPVDPITFESTLQPGVHVLGDAIAGGDMPKSAFGANSQAKACAFAIAANLTGSPNFAQHLLSACYSHIGPDDAFVNAISYKPADGKLRRVAGFGSKVDESAETRRRAARAADAWYDSFTHDVFG